jgi:hypothetical protein
MKEMRWEGASSVGAHGNWNGMNANKVEKL